MATSTAKAETARLNGKAIAARSEAVKKLVEKYAEEFGVLLRDERTKVGLSPESGGDSTRELLTRLEKAREREQKAVEALKARGVEIPDTTS